MTEEQFQEWKEGFRLLYPMTRAELDLVDYDLKKWRCQAKGCCKGTKIRDYGVAPFYYLHRRRGQWFRIDKQFWMCGKHYKLYNRLIKSFTMDHIWSKVFETIATKDKLSDLDRNITKERIIRS